MLAIFAGTASKTPQAAETTWGESWPRNALHWAEALPIFARAEERLHHFGLDEVAVGCIQFAQPEVEPGGVGIAAEVTEVFHRDKGGIVLAGLQLQRFGNGT